jgi:hypothetical protein
MGHDDSDRELNGTVTEWTGFNYLHVHSQRGLSQSALVATTEMKRLSCVSAISALVCQGEVAEKLPFAVFFRTSYHRFQSMAVHHIHGFRCTVLR